MNTMIEHTEASMNTAAQLWLIAHGGWHVRADQVGLATRAAPPTSKTSPLNATGWSNSAWTQTGSILTTA